MGQSTVDAILEQYKNNNTKKSTKKVEFSLKNYFATFLPEGVNALTYRVRILPSPEGESIFKTQYIHQDTVNGNRAKLHCLDKNDDKPCPYCAKFEEEQNIALLEEEGSDERKEKMKAAYKFAPKKMYIIKVIDRNEEGWGPKFWRVPISKKKDGVYDKIVDIVGEKGDISDALEGRDLTIKVIRNSAGYATVSSILQDDKTPLHENQELVDAWLESEKTWGDVYSQKPYEYLELALAGKTPKWDKGSGKFVDEASTQDQNDAPIMDTSDAPLPTPPPAVDNSDDLPF